MNIKKTLSLIFVFALIIPSLNLHADHWVDSTISEWTKQNLLESEDANNFRPDDKITRAEFMGFINTVEGYDRISKKINKGY